jgi:hypothetical protein
MESTNGFRRGGALRSWKLQVALALLGVAALTVQGVAQTPAAEVEASADPTVVVDEWIGRWSGPFESEGELAGFLVITVAHDGEKWVVKCEVLDDGAPPGGPVLAWAVRGDQFSFRQWFEDVELIVAGRLADEEIVGEMEAQREGERLGLATFNLRKVTVNEPPPDSP